MDCSACIGRTTGKITLAFAIFALLCSNPSYAGEEAPSGGGTEDEQRLLVIPFPFSNDTIGPGVGVAVIAEGYGQRQIHAVGAALGSSNGTGYLFLKVKNIQLPWAKRVFLDPTIFYGDVGAVEVYLDGNPSFPGDMAGANDSDEDDFIETEGTDQAYELKMSFLLPIGHGEHRIIPEFKLDDGLLVSGGAGGEQWNPFKSGRTFIELVGFYREQDFEDEDTGVDFIQKTNGLELVLRYDNTDFTSNPSRGSFQEISFARDWGGGDSTNSWSALTVDIQKYFSLGATDKARQRVIALNLWAAHSLTWDNHQPPSYKAANLGGLWRLRGYPATRFHDRSAIYYGVEYRHVPNWNPLKKITLNKRLDVDWLQFAVFAEAGRVAPRWNLGDLHSDMKWSAGVGLRTMVNHLIVRIDYAISSETSLAQLFIGHPF